MGTNRSVLDTTNKYPNHDETDRIELALDKADRCAAVSEVRCSSDEVFVRIRRKSGDTGRTHMNNTVEYKGYVGNVDFSEKDGLFYGKIMGIRALISYEGVTTKELVDDFHRAVEDYLALCETENREPERVHAGNFVRRM